MTLPKTTPATDMATSTMNEATSANSTTTPAEDHATSADVQTTPAEDHPIPADLGQVLSDFMTSMREVQESVRADRERIEELQLANGLVIRQGAPDNEPPTNPPDDSYIDPAQFDPSNMDFKI